MSDSVLRLEHIVKRYGDFTAVRDLSLDVPRGSIYGFLGPNGAGKSTTIRIALSIYAPTSGSIEVLGRPSALDVRERIGYLPEEKGLYRKMKAGDVIAYFGQLKGMTRRDAKHKAVEMLERYGLGANVDSKCEALSKGMQQKVQVLASVVHSPEFVILDEPFSGLDPVNQEVLEQVIADLNKAGSTIVFSTHVMDHAERLCDRIVLIAKGKKLFDGTIPEAKRTVRRRVLLETSSNPELLERLPGVRSVEKTDNANRFEVTLADGARPEEILGACFRSGIELSAFDKNEPSLRDVFLKLVRRADAEEVVA
ncbi:MAG: ATP-binding cassette domain-containing protein [Planctomycetes bacterium]|nr:ATP-binding cassette domain-containing protein [Planctomycetota bacterium]